MILSHKKIIIGLCLLIGAGFAPKKSFALVESGDAIQQSTVTSEGDTLEEHESDGPEGTRGVPMQKSSMIQIVVALVVLVGGGGLARIAWKSHRPLESKNG